MNNENNSNLNEEKSEKKRIKNLLVILSSIVIIVGLGILWFLGYLPIQSIWNSFACFVNTTYTNISKDERAIVPHWYNQDNNHLDKPVIYLYPTEDMELNIKISNVDLTTTYPLYNYNNGWDVEVNKDGTIFDKNGREYNYLYWEGVSDKFVGISEGFVISKDNYIDFLEDKLEYVGLTDKEACDFITYWLPQMNEYDYCLVSFQMENYEKAITLEYNIEPKNELRVFVAFKGLDKMIDIEEQDLSYYSDFERNGFTVVEWGGTFLN